MCSSSTSPLVTYITHNVFDFPRQISFDDPSVISGTTWFSHSLVAAESYELPPPVTNVSEYTFKNSNIAWYFIYPL